MTSSTVSLVLPGSIPSAEHDPAFWTDVNEALTGVGFDGLVRRGYNCVTRGYCTIDHRAVECMTYGIAFCLDCRRPIFKA